MERLYDWLGNITGYLLFISVLDNLLPGKKYGKYLKLFAGMVLILLVIQPFTNGVRLEELIARNYEALVFRDQAADLKEDLLGMEQKRLEQMIAQYESAVGEDVAQMAFELELGVSACKVTINPDVESDTFGSVIHIWVEVTKKKEERFVTSDIEPIEPIVIGSSTENQTEENRKKDEEQQIAVEKLKKKIALYYHLEEEYVEIQILDWKR